MTNSICRIIALLLIPCLLAEPVNASTSAFAPALSRVQPHPRFAEQALSAAALGSHRPDWFIGTLGAIHTTLAELFEMGFELVVSEEGSLKNFTPSNVQKVVQDVLNKKDVIVQSGLKDVDAVLTLMDPYIPPTVSWVSRQEYLEQLRNALNTLQSIQVKKLLVVGSGLSHLPVAAALLGMDVVFIDKDPKRLAHSELTAHYFRNSMAGTFAAIAINIDAVDQLSPKFLRPSSFDAVLMLSLSGPMIGAQSGFEGDPVKAIGNAYRLVKPDGVMAVSNTPMQIGVEVVTMGDLLQRLSPHSHHDETILPIKTPYDVLDDTQYPNHAPNYATVVRDGIRRVDPKYLPVHNLAYRVSKPNPSHSIRHAVATLIFLTTLGLYTTVNAGVVMPVVENGFSMAAATQRAGPPRLSTPEIVDLIGKEKGKPLTDADTLMAAGFLNEFLNWFYTTVGNDYVQTWPIGMLNTKLPEFRERLTAKDSRERLDIFYRLDGVPVRVLGISDTEPGFQARHPRFQLFINKDKNLLFVITPEGAFRISSVPGRKAGEGTRFLFRVLAEPTDLPTQPLQRDAAWPISTFLFGVLGASIWHGGKRMTTLDQVLLQAGVDVRHFSRIIYPASGSDLPFISHLLPLFPEVKDVYLISLGYERDPIQFKDVQQRAELLREAYQKAGRQIRFHLRAENFFNTFIAPDEGRTVMIDKVFGEFGKGQNDPRYHQALARNTRAGDVIVSLPMVVFNLPFQYQIATDIAIPGYDNRTDFNVYLLAQDENVAANAAVMTLGMDFGLTQLILGLWNSWANFSHQKTSRRVLSAV